MADYDDSDAGAAIDPVTLEEQLQEQREALNDAITTAYQEQNQKLFDIAEDWANRPGLHETERTHGVVFNILTHIEAQTLDESVTVERPRQSDEYASFFDEKKVDQIKAGLIRSSAELFD